jgi:hypothetical protein
MDEDRLANGILVVAARIGQSVAHFPAARMAATRAARGWKSRRESWRNTFSGGQCSFDAKRTLLTLETKA